MSTKPLEPAAEILGYKLEKRIGSGGFGEVWAVDAPGGLKKALKIVYGYHDEKRAQAELKALDRVKSLRHPFLLSLERIEVFEGQLIVVTELADASLADHFNFYISKGEPGIPRDEMLSYMSNAAEALDFLSQEKSLQHLDVKPENLLLVGKHAKVADFGLMKDLKQASQSLMQGMTPAYAAPELFDGAPAPSSDQYSLAIMYCEMISGVRPFPGTTPAQLAAQHVHGKPNLRPIPRGDHAAVARALAKDPAARYPSCVAFVEDLKKQRRTVRIARKRGESRESVSDSLLYDMDQCRRPDVTEMVSERSLPFQPDSMVSGEPPNCDGTKAKVHPTLIITVGDTANRAGQKFKAKLLARTGDDEKVPSIRSVFIDSDRKGLAQLESIAKGTVRTDETIAVPLRKAEDYRNKADAHLGWLARRWIYNVPRTLQTEGLRPLGRLVFADHFATLCDRLERVIGEFCLEENLAKTADTLNIDPGAHDTPRIYIISSISGGIGSGMTLDLAYTIKLLLAEKGLNPDGVTGILLHSTYQRSRDPGLSAANSFAFLTELRHFNEYGYPGDANLGIPEFDDEAPFQQTYYTELGDDLNQSDFDTKLDSVAEYLSMAVTTPCGDFFDSCRENEMEMDHFALRTFGVATIGSGDDKQRERQVESVCQNLIQRWGSVGDYGYDPEALSNHILEQLHINLPLIEQKLHRQMAHARGFDDTQILGCVRAQFEKRQSIDYVLKGIYGSNVEDDSDPNAGSTPLTQAIEFFLTTEPLTGHSVISKACFSMLSSQHLYLGSVEATAAILRDRFAGWLETVKQKLAVVRANIEALKAAIASLPAAGEPGFCDQTTNQYLAQLCVEFEAEFVKRFTCQFLEVIITDLQPVHTVVHQLKTNLQDACSGFEGPGATFGQEVNEGIDLRYLMTKQIESKLDVMAEQVERMVYHSLIEPEGGFQHALTDYTIMNYNLPEAMRTAAQRVISHANDTLSVESMIRENAIAPEQLFRWLTGLINRAKPVVNDCGGKMSLLVSTPIRGGASRVPKLIESNFQLKNVAINGTNGKIAVCFEAEDLPLASVAFRLLAKRPDAVELVKRIHTRSDVDWTSLDDLL